MERGYTLRQAASELGCSRSWIRGLIRRGAIEPPKVRGKHGMEYRLAESDVEILRAAYPERGRKAAETRISRLAELEHEHQARLVDMQHRLMDLTVKASAAQERGEAERERAERAEYDLRAERARVEQLKALSVVDRLLGRHKRV